ncbi:MAG: hypothetical protein Ta2F_16210 [Termitinemataceae bacterium]|nr:MAG: hypothetical protein Ta2F_16210 [Termitinemataceae bacterium]
MKTKNRFFYIPAAFVLFVFSMPQLSAAEFYDSRARLSIDEKVGRFLFYYLADVDKKNSWEPLFWAKDKRTSFLSVSVNDKEYKLGETTAFKVRVRGTDKKPVLAYESPFLSITEEFSFIRTASSGVSNGIRIDLQVENWGEEKVTVGLRLLIDSYLGEKNIPHFRTDLRAVGSETVINRTTKDQYWLSRNGQLGLMGSVFVDGVDGPDFVHFGNWKRLANARFESDYVSTRSFSDMPFSSKDSAVCYYLEPQSMERWQKRSMTILLAAEDQYGFSVVKSRPPPDFEYGYTEVIRKDGPLTTNTQNVTVASDSGSARTDSNQVHGAAAISQPNIPFVGGGGGGRSPIAIMPLGPMRIDLMTLRELIYKVDGYIYSGNKISEAELKAMENAIAILKARYGAVFKSF